MTLFVEAVPVLFVALLAISVWVSDRRQRRARDNFRLRGWR